MKKSLSIVALVLAMTPLVAQETRNSSFHAVAIAAKPPTVLITGSSRGIGFELTKQYAAKGWQVIATCRRPSQADALRGLARQYPHVVVEQLDVTDNAEIETLAAKYRETPIDVLINNAGIFGDRRLQTFGVDFSPILISMLPYLLTIGVLILLSIRSRHQPSPAPAAIGQIWRREER